MYQKQILSLFDKKTVLTNKYIHEQICDNDKTYAIINTELKRLCDKNMLERIGKGVYVRKDLTEWGEIIPTDLEIIYSYYLDDGFITGAKYLNQIGVSTLTPNSLEIVTNNYRHKLYRINNIKLIQPKTQITRGNVQYLQLLNGIDNYYINHCDAKEPYLIFYKEIQRLKLDELKLLVYAKRYYTKRVVDFLIDMEERYYEIA